MNCYCYYFGGQHLFAKKNALWSFDNALLSSPLSLGAASHVETCRSEELLKTGFLNQVSTPLTNIFRDMSPSTGFLLVLSSSPRGSIPDFHIRDGNGVTVAHGEAKVIVYITSQHLYACDPRWKLTTSEMSVRVHALQLKLI